MRLTIITVNLNNKYGLQKTIDSVISQTFKDFEWIVIDGGSTDGSKELIEQHSERISFWVCEPDGGIYNAMNKGIKAAKGEYLQFLNSGDVFINKNTLLRFFRNHLNADIVFGNTLIDDENGLRRVNYQNDYLTCYRLAKGTINHQSAFIKRELFDKYGLYDESLRIVSDWKFFFETIVVHKCSKYHIDQDMVLFDTTGISSTNVELLRKEREFVLREFLPEYAVDDYLHRLELNELFNHRFSQIIVSLLYRLVIWLERQGFICSNV